jgi:hypothetical protein
MLNKILRKLLKGYVFVDTIFDIGFIVFLCLALCGLVYYRQLYDSPFYLFIAAVICVVLILLLYEKIRNLINLK